MRSPAGWSSASSSARCCPGSTRSGPRSASGHSPTRPTTSPASPPLVLYYSAEPFEYRRSEWPSNFRLVGPGAWDPPAEPLAWLDAVDQPLVLVTCSSDFQNDGKLLDAALAGLAEEDVFVVATTAGVDPRGFATPANARVERYLPHGPLLERAACVVCHAGMGITQKALGACVPVCAVPFGRDQFEVARRVQVADAGVMLPKGKLSPKQLRRAVKEAMAKRAGAARVAAGFAAAGGAAAAADGLEEIGRGDAGAVERCKNGSPSVA
jgi:MGT family glycosyltransferase